MKDKSCIKFSIVLNVPLFAPPLLSFLLSQHLSVECSSSSSDS